MNQKSLFEIFKENLKEKNKNERIVLNKLQEGWEAIFKIEKIDFENFMKYPYLTVITTLAIGFNQR